MKKLIVSIKSTTQVLDEARNRLKSIQKKKGSVTPHYEISFTEMKSFKRFVTNINILMSIQNLRPRSIYELAAMMKKDVGNLNKTINFFEELGVLELKERKRGGRTVKTPVVPYQKIEFDLAA